MSEELKTQPEEQKHQHDASCGHDSLGKVRMQSTLSFQQFEQNGWAFYHSDYPMFSTKQLDLISDQVGTMAMPEVFYGFNRLYIAHPQKDLLLEFSPIEGLSLAAFAKRQALLAKKKDEESKTLESLMENLSISPEERHLNQIDVIPEPIQAKEAVHWKGKDTSKVKDFKQIEIISDWTYSSSYKGNVRYISNNFERIKKETSLELNHSKREKTLKIEETDEQIPVEMLGKDNPILHFNEVFLYEDDLGDTGYTRMSVRFRVMNNCFYVLLRYYLRVDEVLVRIYDTRIFHQFGKDYVIRDFQHKENSYEELKTKGFKIDSAWGLSKNQSDEVYPHLDLKFKKNDKVIFE